MFENQNAKTELMIVCDEKLMEYANYLMALIGQNDDVDGEVVGTKDGMVTAAIYTPKNYKDTLPKITSNTHILFIGSFKEAKEQGKNVDFKLQEATRTGRKNILLCLNGIKMKMTDSQTPMLLST